MTGNEMKERIRSKRVFLQVTYLDTDIHVHITHKEALRLRERLDGEFSIYGHGRYSVVLCRDTLEKEKNDG